MIIGDYISEPRKREKVVSTMLRLPSSLHSALKREAKQKGWSLNEYLIYRLYFPIYLAEIKATMKESLIELLEKADQVERFQRAIKTMVLTEKANKDPSKVGNLSVHCNAQDAPEFGVA